MAENPDTGSNTPDSLIVYHHSELSKLEREESEANEALKAVRKRKRDYRKTIEADGLKLKNFDRARDVLMADEEEVREDLAETGRILRAFKAPLGHQFDMFEEPTRDTLEERWRYQGFLVGARGGDVNENPHHPGDKGHKVWLDGYKGAQASIAMGLEQSQASEQDEPEPENVVGKPATPEELHDYPEDVPGVELEDDEADWRAERDAEIEDAPATEDEAVEVE